MIRTTLVCFAVSASGAAAESYWGEFLDTLDVTMDINPDGNWTEIELHDDYRFIDPNTLVWTTPGGHTVNGASIPRWAWTIVGSPYTGRYLPASVIHDYYCFTRERTAHDTHRNFYYGMRANGVGYVKAKTMHWAVSLYSSWDITAPGEIIALNQLDVTSNEGLAAIEETLSQVQAQFQSELEAIQRGEVDANTFSPELVEQDADSFREILLGQRQIQNYEGYADPSSVEAFSIEGFNAQAYTFRPVEFDLEAQLPIRDVESVADLIETIAPEGVPFEADVAVAPGTTLKSAILEFDFQSTPFAAWDGEMTLHTSEEDAVDGVVARVFETLPGEGAQEPSVMMWDGNTRGAAHAITRLTEMGHGITTDARDIAIEQAPIQTQQDRSGGMVMSIRPDVAAGTDFQLNSVVGLESIAGIER